MWKTVIRAGESPEELSERLNVPVCMLLRANGLFSPAWLLEGREIHVPDGEYCLHAEFPCPALLMRIPAAERACLIIRKDDSAGDIASLLSVPVRVVLACAGEKDLKNSEGRVLDVPLPPEGSRICTVQPGDTFASFSRGREMYLRSVNALWGPLYPGMKVLI